MPLDQLTLTDATEIREHIERATSHLHRSIEAERGLMRSHYCARAAGQLLCAAALADNDERRILAGYYRTAETLAEHFYGDGVGVQRLLDELDGRFGGDADAHEPSREGIFREHDCARCKSGERACVRGNPRQCEWPRTSRNGTTPATAHGPNGRHIKDDSA